MTRPAALLLLLAVAPAARADPVPSYDRHVAALFSRLGCNGGACHGAVRGQNGFRLSLFGADPAADRDRLLREFGGRRLNLTDPAASLLLRKATGEAEHGGGVRLKAGVARVRHPPPLDRRRRPRRPARACDRTAGVARGAGGEAR